MRPRRPRGGLRPSWVANAPSARREDNGRLVDLRIDFVRKLAGIREAYDLGLKDGGTDD
jgi:hypothetical protein